LTGGQILAPGGISRLAAGPTSTWLIAWIFVFLATSIVATIFATQWYSSQGPHGYGGNWPSMIRHALAQWWTWAALAPAVLAIGVAVPTHRARAGRALLIHAAACLFFIVLHVALVAVLELSFHAEEAKQLTWAQHFDHVLRQQTAPDVVIYCALVGLGQLVLLRTRLVSRDRDAAQLEAQLTQAKLEALRVQLNPHFLFNALNAISGLVRHDPEQADRAIADLGDILRNALQQNEGMVPLTEELDLVRRYLAIEEIRLRDRLKLEFEIDERARNVMVPVFALQLLVENAVRHAIEPRTSGGTIKITAERTEKGIALSVEDHGIDPAASATPGSGVGLANIRARLHHLFGKAAELITESHPGGTRVRLILPG
jgi:two-component system LytT family sensor kinase